jgi:tetratricopeptide (TPR) repeat protein
MNVQTISNNSALKTIPLKRVLRVATAVGAIVLLLLLLWRGYHIYQLSVDKIYKESYVPYKIANAPITDTTTFTTIELYFAEGDYMEVVKLSKGLLSVTDRERLLIGIAYLQKEEYLPAISWLKRIADLEGTPYQEAAEYYLTLTHLRNEDYDRTIELMQQITSNNNHPYRKQFTYRMIREVRLLKWK